MNLSLVVLGGQCDAARSSEERLYPRVEEEAGLCAYTYTFEQPFPSHLKEHR